MDYVRLHASLRADSPAVTDLAFNRQWTYGELDHLIAGCTALLQEKGVSEGDRVACLSKNRAEFIMLHLASARLGAIFVPLNWRLSAAELEVIIADCSPSLIYGDDLATELKVEAQDIEQLLPQCEKRNPVWPPQPSVDLPSLMLYTSGTTGKPKGVLLSERNLTETAINFCLLGEVEPGSRFLCESPMFHIIGMVTSVRPPLFLGAQIIISDRFLPERTLERLADKDLQISHYFCVPQMALAMRAVDVFDASSLCGLKAIFTGGAPHPEAQIREWLDDGIPIVDGFGMSEAGTIFGMPLNRNLIDQKVGSVGIPTPRLQSRIADESGRALPDNEAGELQLKGDNVTVGYWNRDSVYADSFTLDGWFKTGDILRRDEDGYFWVVDRKKDMFISGGENVYPVEVEAQLVKFPGLKDLAVIGVPDEKWGEVGCLYYVPKEAGWEIDMAELDSFLTSRLARYKIPKKAVAVESLPRNGVGKLMRHELRKLTVSE
ncbi:MAG: acyl-CoA synthetase [Gammaproteobacteria bacterium]|nr:acyl-CoA synthetase [Gammaproteobacteria bacterium]